MIGAGAFEEACRRIKRMVGDGRVRLMEVCGTHTVSISRAGLRSLLAPQVELISGPGCPVCVTAAPDIAKTLWLAESGKTVVTFGDMMKVPVDGRSLFDLRASGADVRVVYSPMEAVEIAQESPGKEVVFIGVGFETTAPTIAAAIVTAKQRKLGNFSVFVALKTIPKPLEIICQSPKIGVDGFILPGHVSAVIGSEPYGFIAERYHRPGVITGFEPEDVIDGVYRLVGMLSRGEARIEISYSRVVRPEGNRAAQKLMHKVFEPCDSNWRGIGMLPQSGLKMRREFLEFDAQSRFGIPDFPNARDNPACRCADVILGVAKPTQCPLFAKACTPQHPQGPCMISSEGACAAYYKYGE